MGSAVEDGLKSLESILWPSINQFFIENKMLSYRRETALQDAL